MDNFEDSKENTFTVANKAITKSKENTLGKISRSRCQKAKKTLSYIQERMLQYEKKLQEIKEKIVHISPQKWIGEEDQNYSDCESYEEFDLADLTPIKGSVSKIERKRRIFDMMKAFTDVLQSVFKVTSLRQNQVAVIQKLKSGNNVSLSDLRESGKSMVYVLLKAMRDKRYRSDGLFLVILPRIKVQKVAEYLSKAKIIFQTYDNDGDDILDSVDVVLAEYENFDPCFFSQKLLSKDRENKNLIKMIVFDSCLSLSNSQNYYPLVETFKHAQIFFCGLYTQYELQSLSRLFNVPSRYKFSLEKNIKQKIKHFSISKDADKVKALLSFIKQHIDGLGRTKGELNFVKDISFKNLFPLALLADVKKDRERLTEGLFKIGVKVESISDLEKNKMNASGSPNGKKSAVEKEDSGMVAYLGTTSQRLEGFGINMVFILNFPRSPEHLLELVNFGDIKHHLFFSDKEFMKKRSVNFLMEFLEPACLLRTFKMMKRLSGVANLGTKALRMEIENSNKKARMQEEGDCEEIEEKKLDKREFEVLKLRKSVISKMLHCTKSEPFNWIINKLKERENFTLAGKCPLVVKIGFKIPNIDKSEDMTIKRIVKHSVQQSGKYKLNLLKFSGSLEENTIKMMNNNKIMTNSNLMHEVIKSSKMALTNLSSLKSNGVLSFESIDDLIFLKPKEALTDVEIYQIIAERRQSELNSLQRYDLLYSILESNSLGVLEQLLKGISRSKNCIDLESYLANIYLFNKKSDEIHPGMKTALRMKNQFNQREKSTIVKDFSLIVEKESHHFKGIFSSLSRFGDDIKKRSIVLNLLKEVFSGVKKSKLNFLKTNPSFLKKYSEYDFLAVYEVIFKNFKYLKLHKLSKG